MTGCRRRADGAWALLALRFIPLSLVAAPDDRSGGACSRAYASAHASRRRSKEIARRHCAFKHAAFAGRLMEARHGGLRTARARCRLMECPGWLITGGLCLRLSQPARPLRSEIHEMHCIISGIALASNASTGLAGEQAKISKVHHFNQASEPAANDEGCCFQAAACTSADRVVDS